LSSPSQSILFSNFQTGEPYAQLTDDGNGCPGKYDQSTTYEIGDTVEDNGVVYTCEGAAAFCNQNAPNLRDVGANYWKATASCTGTAIPTDSPTWSTGSIQDGCPEEYDSNAIYEANESVSVPRDDGISIIYTCKPFPESQWCSDDTYSPMNTEKLCDGEVCWSKAWNKAGPCDGTYTPTGTPTFDPANVGGCPEEFDAAAAAVNVLEYKPGDKVSVTPAGEAYGKVYQCKAWPMGAHCAQAGYSPAEIDSKWKDAWTYVGGCYGTISPTSTPTFDPANVGGCPEEYDEVAVAANTAKYKEGDKVSVTPAGEAYGKVYQCKAWPMGAYCAQAEYSPADIDSAWSDAWTYVGGCYGTISPTSTPTFDPANVEGCPELFDDDAEYEEGDKVSVISTGETYGKVYECKAWPARCGQDGFSPAEIDSEWSTAWTYVGGCTGTISPTASPVFQTLSAWDLGGCPEEYDPSVQYKPEDVVSVPKNADNTSGVVWKCKNAKTAPFCQNESYAPGTANGGKAWEKMGYCEGTIAPTDAPVQYTDLCQFKYKLKAATNSEYIILQAEDWVNGGTTVSTGTGGTSLNLYKAGNLVRYGNDARKCASYPNSGYCNQYSPFVQDATYNPTNSPKGWSDATCEDVVSAGDTNGDDDEFDPSTGGPVFASNGDMLVDASGNCLNGAINPEDYLKGGAGCSKFAATTAAVLKGATAQPSMMPSSMPSSAPSLSYKAVGNGKCQDTLAQYYPAIYYDNIGDSAAQCAELCGCAKREGVNLRGFEFKKADEGCIDKGCYKWCYCLVDPISDESVASELSTTCAPGPSYPQNIIYMGFIGFSTGSGEITTSTGDHDPGTCYKFL
jgi:hypothetical protein